MSSELNLVDLIIIVVIAIEAFMWARRGFVRGFLALAGFVVGLVASLLLIPLFIDFINEPASKLLVSLLTIITLSAIGSQLGAQLAGPLHIFFERIKLDNVNRVVGSLFGVSATLFVCWALAATLVGSPFTEVNRQLQHSAIISSLNRVFPPSPALSQYLGSLINPNDFPRVFLGQEPRPLTTSELPNDEELRAMLQKVGTSTVRIESTGCSELSSGSGFVAKDGIVVTNAHVIAGKGETLVRDKNGLRQARVIHFDPQLDVALLAVDNLAGEPLPLSTEPVAYGAKGAVVGYPKGGPLNISASVALDTVRARGTNIYDNATVTRTIHVLQADIVQGNSGGPAINQNGEVIGVVFATALTENNVGYAFTSDQITTTLANARTDNPTTSTGSCTK